MNSILQVLKEFLKDLKGCLKSYKTSKFDVFFERPRMFIWLLVCYFIMTSKYLSIATIKPILCFILMFGTLLCYLVFIAFVSSNIAEKVLRYASSVRKIATNTEKERLIPLFKEVYTQAFRNNKHIGRKIKPYIVDSMEVNAFIIGRNTLVVTRGAIETFNDDELKGVMAHEFGHINHYDGQITLLVTFCTTIFLWAFIAVSFVFRLLEKLFENNIIGDIFGIVRQIFELVVKFVLFIWTLIISGGSRRKEYKADMYAKSIGYGEQLKSALYILYDMEISDKKGLMQNLKRTHPILAYRIEKLESSQNG